MIVSVLKSIKGVAESVAHPVKAVQGFAIRMIVKGIVKSVNAAISAVDKSGATSSHAAVRQLNGLVDKNTDMTGLSKQLNFNLTLDDIIEFNEDNGNLEANNGSESGVFSTIKDKVVKIKQDSRQSIFDFIVKDNFSNVNDIAEAVNEILNSPTELAGCNFITVNMSVGDVDYASHNLVLNINIEFELKAK